MITVWNKVLRDLMNHSLAFSYKFENKKGAKIKIKSSGVYRMFVNGEFLAYGPARAAHGYVRIDEYSLPLGNINIVFEVYANNCNSYYLLDELPYFGAEITCCGEIIADIKDFKAFYINDRVVKSHRASFQRCFVESYDMKKDRKAFYLGDESFFPEVETNEVEGPKVLSRNVSYPELKYIAFPDSFEDGGIIINKEKVPVFRSRALNDAEYSKDTFKAYRYEELSECLYDEFFQMEYYKNGDKKEGYYKTYDTKRTLCGFFSLKCKVLSECDVYILCDELSFPKENCTEINHERNDLTSAVKYHLQKGEYDLISFEPYVGRFFRLNVIGGDIEIEKLGLITYENPDTENFSFTTGDYKLDKIIEAARNTFIHNALDVLTDCPARERAGWLCDSYFSGQAEKFFTGKNSVEKNFLENLILSPQLNELPEGMLPMCYPADHYNGNHIPNWALWFILELENYLERTGDTELVKLARNKVDGVLNYFKECENEYNLLENLKGWVFVEWSACNNDDHVTGVNFPSNMLYMDALRAAGKLYGDASYTEKSEIIRENILKFGFNGEFFVDNSLRDGNNLVRTENITETCQYYAMFFKLISKESHPKLWAKMVDEFGPKRNYEKTYPEVSESNAFIGNYLRLEVLLREKDNEKVLDECKSFFINMAEKTGTLWEHMGENASLDHGFASIAALYIYKALSKE